MLIRDTLFIGGRHVTPSSPEMIEVVSPITEQPMGLVPRATPADIDAAVTAARRAFDEGPWRRMSIAERGALLTAFAERLEPLTEELTHLQIDEMGSPYRFMRDATAGLVDKVEDQLQAALSVRLRDERSSRGAQIIVMREPVGVVGIIYPWNGPVAGLVAKMLPPLLNGCTVVVKPPLESPISPLRVADVAAEIGFPPGVMSIVPGGADVGEHLVTNHGVDKIGFTGSTSVGQHVGALCGQRIKSVTLELGGKSAAIILDDADLERHIPRLVSGVMSNNGQVCYATTRILASTKRLDEVRDRLVATIGALRVGDPHDVDTDIGPLVSRRQRDRVVEYIHAGIAAGAKLDCGGVSGAPAPGWFVKPTLFSAVDNSMRVAQEEIFGPVACLISYRDEDEAVRIANDSSYGLGGAVITEDRERGVSVASRMQTGSVSINHGPSGGGGGPFGGVKQSGLGRERGVEGHESYYELKSVTLPAE